MGCQLRGICRAKPVPVGRHGGSDAAPLFFAELLHQVEELVVLERGPGRKIGGQERVEPAIEVFR